MLTPATAPVGTKVKIPAANPVLRPDSIAHFLAAMSRDGYTLPWLVVESWTDDRRFVYLRYERDACQFRAPKGACFASKDLDLYQTPEELALTAEGQLVLTEQQAAQPAYWTTSRRGGGLRTITFEEAFDRACAAAKAASRARVDEDFAEMKLQQRAWFLRMKAWSGNTADLLLRLADARHHNRIAPGIFRVAVRLAVNTPVGQGHRPPHHELQRVELRRLQSIHVTFPTKTGQFVIGHGIRGMYLADFMPHNG